MEIEIKGTRYVKRGEYWFRLVPAEVKEATYEAVSEREQDMLERIRNAQ